MFAFTSTIFLGAFLLFVVEPMIAKLLLPHFGGSASVWVAALLFFQSALLAGYAWADVLVRRFPPLAQRNLQVGLLVLSCFTLPLATGERLLGWLSGWPPVLQVLCVLAA